MGRLILTSCPFNDLGALNGSFEALSLLLFGVTRMGDRT